LAHSVINKLTPLKMYKKGVLSVWDLNHRGSTFRVLRQGGTESGGGGEGVVSCFNC
jgi:hypothetical protein